MNKKGFIFSFLLFMSCFFVIGNVKALTTLDGQDFPDFPNKQYHHIIVERLNNNGYALLENSYGGNMYVDNGVIYNKNQSFKIYDLVDNSWIVRGSTNTAFSYNSIIATTTSIYSSSSLSSVSYSSGYNLFKFPSFEMVFNDTSGYYKNGFYFNQSSLDYIWNQLFEGKSYNYYSGYNYNLIPSIYSSSIFFEPWKKDDFPNLACQYMNNSYFQCVFLEDLDNMNFSKDSNSYFTYSNSLNRYGSYPGFKFTTSTGVIETFITSSSFFSFNNTYSSSWSTNFDVINKDTGVTYKNKVFDYDIGPKIYNTNNIDYIEYKFDNLPLQETELHIDYTFKSVTSDGQDDTIDFSAPFARDTYTGCDDLGGNCTTDEKYKDLLMYPIGTTGHIFQGSGNHILNSSPEHITNSFSIIIPFEYSLGSYVALDFDANLDYEMIIHYKDDENSVNSYIDTVDITGKYGAIFLPKYDDSNYVDSDSYYLTNFRIVGNVDVQVTDSRDMNNYNIQQIYSMNYCNTVYSNQTEIPYNCDNQSGIFSFRIDNLRANQTLRFVNHSYTEMSDRRTLIEYDTRFFNYGILDEPTSVVQIEDPTTHVVETVGLSDFYNQLNEENIGKSKITFKSAFNRFVSPIKFIFRTITNLYNNYLSSSVQHYFFLVFCLMILLLLIRVIF